MTDKPILVGVDGSPVSEAALTWAARAADGWGRELVIVLAGDIADPEEVAIGSPDPSADLLRDAHDSVRRAGITCEIRTLLHDEQPEPLFDRLSRDATAIVVGAGTEGRLASLLFGSVSRHLEAHSYCPVVTVPPSWINRPVSDAALVVVGVKPTPGGIEALDFAMSYAAATGSNVLAIRCWDRRSALNPDDPLAERDIQQAVLDGLVLDASARYPYVQVAKQVTAGSVHDVLRLAARGADLLVLGTRYPAGPKGSRLGPTTAGLTRRMPCPVAVVSAPGTVEPAPLPEGRASHALGA
ncbi:universal stress protein [Jatrophihabitans sp.]|uniref:universal stress protein n=1 Tax=Jatrophihabitans sp. TaxID=1932789 RepID=UPI0030C778EA|nr:hypothetical protein [Jatrophihabitans sp.]